MTPEEFLGLPRQPWPWEEENRPRIADEDLVQAQEWRHAMVSLLANPGWQLLMKIAKENFIHTRNQRYALVPLNSTDEVLAEQFMKGELSGLHLIINTPNELLEQANEIIEAAKALDDNEEDS